MNKINIITDHPIAVSSFDHIEPKGTANDNLHCHAFAVQMVEKFGKNLSYLDIGCAGGGLVSDMLDLGVLACGVDGSDFSQKSERDHWGDKTRDFLFTADISKPFCFKETFEQTFSELALNSILVSDVLRFDVITSFDVLEHMNNEEELDEVLNNIYHNLKNGGYTIHSIANFEDPGYHHILEDEDWWIKKFESKGFKQVTDWDDLIYPRRSTHNLCFVKN